MTQGKRVPEKLTDTHEVIIGLLIGEGFDPPIAREVVRRYNAHEKLVEACNAAFKALMRAEKILGADCGATDLCAEALREAGESPNG